MKLLYTLLELGWEYKNRTCDFCSNHYKSVNLIKTRHEKTGELIAVDCVCENCKVKFLNNELLKCEKCGRLQTRTDIALGGICDCQKEDTKEKELPALPHESMTTFYERQINSLREEKDQLTEEVETHLEALEVSEVWNKRQKQELLDRIKKLEEENKQLKAQIEVKK